MLLKMADALRTVRAALEGLIKMTKTGIHLRLDSDDLKSLEALADYAGCSSVQEFLRQNIKSMMREKLIKDIVSKKVDLLLTEAKNKTKAKLLKKSEDES